MGSKELKAALKRAGIPSSYITTTLPREGHQELRSWIDNEVFIHEAGIKGVTFISATPATFSKARRVFFVFAKEMVISGYSVVVHDMVSVLELSQTPVVSAKNLRSGYDFIFIPDFAEGGASAPFDGETALKVRTFLRKLIDYGVGICTLSDRPQAAGQWYPDSLLALMSENSFAYPIAGR